MASELPGSLPLEMAIFSSVVGCRMCAPQSASRLENMQSPAERRDTGTAVFLMTAEEARPSARASVRSCAPIGSDLGSRQMDCFFYEMPAHSFIGWVRRRSICRG